MAEDLKRKLRKHRRLPDARETQGDPKAKGKSPPQGTYLAGHEASRVCNTPYDVTIPKATTSSSYYKKVATGRKGKTAPKSLKGVRIYVQKCSAALKDVAST